MHFAMHAFADSLEPLDSRLVFPGPAEQRDSLDLYAWELFQMQLDADLVVLGACESAWGPYQEGEGLHSLSRAFLHSGARSIIGSLWLSADQSSAEIMDEFYSRAALGMPLDVALQQARVAQIKRTDEQGAHPFFWSGYILVGDDQPLKVETAFGSERSIFALVLLLAVASLMVFLTEKPV
jgi:CHAT domain-containing protein